MTGGAFLLLGEDLTIRPDGQPPKRNSLRLSSSEPQNKTDKPTMSDSERATLWWMATLDDAFPGLGGVNPVLIDNPPAVNSEILARVQLGEGSLKTLDLSPDPVRFVFGSPSFRQFVALKLRLAVDFTSFVEIVMESKSQSGQQVVRKLVLKPAAASGEILIDIQNQEIDTLIGIPPSYPTKRAEADFEVYARLNPNLPAVIAAKAAGTLPFLQVPPGFPTHG